MRRTLPRHGGGEARQPQREDGAGVGGALRVLLEAGRHRQSETIGYPQSSSSIHSGKSSAQRPWPLQVVGSTRSAFVTRRP